MGLGVEHGQRHRSVCWKRFHTASHRTAREKCEPRYHLTRGGDKAIMKRSSFTAGPYSCAPPAPHRL
jgi:hypothetical protein